MRKNLDDGGHVAQGEDEARQRERGNQGCQSTYEKSHLLRLGDGGDQDAYAETCENEKPGGRDEGKETALDGDSEEKRRG